MFITSRCPVKRLVKGDIIGLSRNGELKACLVLDCEIMGDNVHIIYHRLFNSERTFMDVDHVHTKCDISGSKLFASDHYVERFVPYEL